MNLDIIINRVSKELSLPKEFVRDVLKYGFKNVAKDMEERVAKTTLLYITTFIRKKTKTEVRKIYFGHEVNKNKQQ
jgi:hypothetical protein